MAFFDQLGQKLTQTSQDAVKKTKDMAEVVRLNSAVADEGKKIEAAYREIGRLYYKRFADACDPALRVPVEEVRRAEAAIREMKDAIFRLKGVQICSACGAELPAGGAFCNSCGAKLPEPPKPAFPSCPACGAPVEPDTVFCTNCGVKLPEPAPVPVSAPAPTPAPVPEPVPVPAPDQNEQAEPPQA